MLCDAGDANRLEWSLGGGPAFASTFQEYCFSHAAIKNTKMGTFLLECDESTFPNVPGNACHRILLLCVIRGLDKKEGVATFMSKQSPSPRGPRVSRFCVRINQQTPFYPTQKDAPL